MKLPNHEPTSKSIIVSIGFVGRGKWVLRNDADQERSEAREATETSSLDGLGQPHLAGSRHLAGTKIRMTDQTLLEQQAEFQK